LSVKVFKVQPDADLTCSLELPEDMESVSMKVARSCSS